MQQAELLTKGTKIRILKVNARNLQRWLGREVEIISIDGDNIYVNAGDGLGKKHLTLEPGWFEILTEDVRIAQHELELFRKVYLNLPDDDVLVNVEEMLQRLGFKYTTSEVESVLIELSEQVNARQDKCQLTYGSGKHPRWVCYGMVSN